MPPPGYSSPTSFFLEPPGPSNSPQHASPSFLPSEGVPQIGLPYPCTKLKHNDEKEILQVELIELIMQPLKIELVVEKETC